MNALSLNESIHERFLFREVDDFSVLGLKRSFRPTDVRVLARFFIFQLQWRGLFLCVQVIFSHTAIFTCRTGLGPSRVQNIDGELDSIMQQLQLEGWFFLPVHCSPEFQKSTHFRSQSQFGCFLSPQNWIQTVDDSKVEGSGDVGQDSISILGIISVSSGDFQGRSDGVRLSDDSAVAVPDRRAGCRRHKCVRMSFHGSLSGAFLEGRWTEKDSSHVSH
ncbi:hypothetical protein CEXT_177151 [Caerostris extrusa]|uniref:Uncharacterized protein n=1 Tax=Caerostris extrusa TaxID=172846 RepID=A0AAV4WX08_CAEEX|nr:hypothetical protein CEXT_177151 [Caerostris extrusa]